MVSSDFSELLEDSGNSDSGVEFDSAAAATADDDDDDDDDLVADLLPAFFLDIVLFLLTLAETALDVLFRFGCLRIDAPSDSSAIPKWARASSARQQRS